MSAHTVPEFSLTGSLPVGTTVLEASAGTGKTYTIAGLVTRYVAEGRCRLPELLVVTFTRAATAELRDRVRRRLVTAGSHLEAVLAGAPAVHDDQVAALLADADETTVASRAGNVAAALAEFDAATVATIHGFCQHVLTGLGVAGDVDRDASLLEDVRDVIDAVVDDLLVATFHADGDLAPVSRRDLAAIAEQVVGNPDAVLVPDDDVSDPQAAVRARLARRIRAEVDRRKRRRGLLSYDDLLTRLADTLTDPDRGPAARATLRERYKVALIDEFQDTDPIQWRILASAFDDGPAARDPARALVLIGDPKQAIYAFRGADVFAYLDAAGAAAERATLATNWRSDAPLLRAYDALFDGARFGDERIGYRPVRPAPGHEHAGLDGAPSPSALRLRVVRRDAEVRTTSKGRFLEAGAARRHIADDLAAEIIALLDAPTRLTGDGHGSRLLEPRDIAVLVPTNRDAALVHRTLLDLRVPAIINGVGSVFATPAAAEWRRLLEALERPSHPSRLRAVALTAFVGWTGEEVADADDEATDRLHDRLHAWAAVLRDHGVASLLRTISLQRRLPARLLARPDGERFLTDIEHIGELLHAAAVGEQLGPTALAGWLRERMAEVEDIAPDEQARRLESDEEAVQILTIHRSKGLEFPVVLCPYLWSSGGRWEAAPVFHDDEHGMRRTVDVGGTGWGGFADHRSAAERERAGEQLRLLYVALTRAKHQAIVWWAPVQHADKSPLARTLFCRRNGGPIKPCTAGGAPPDDATVERLGQLAARAGGTIAVETTPARITPTAWGGRGTPPAALSAAVFDRPLDTAWHRTSYSRLTAPAAHDARVGSEPATRTVDDESSLTPVTPPAATDADAPGTGGATGAAGGQARDDHEATLRAVPCPLGAMPAGPEVGTLVHAVLETTDFAAEDLAGELDRVLAEQLDRWRVDVGDRDTTLAGLEAAVTTPLGALSGDRPLTRFGPADRLNELDFELPLVGADDPGGRAAATPPVTVAGIGALVDRWLPADDPLAGYGATLAAAPFRHDVRGYLTGSIDLVLRTGPADAPRFVVVDHKTNRLGTWGEPLTAWDYRPAALVEAMVHHHYPLQALLYLVALHRFLRWRLDVPGGYDPATHLGGAGYLFLRGMTGPDVPTVDGQPCGVFTWRPPAGLVVAVSDLLDGQGVVA